MKLTDNVTYTYDHLMNYEEIRTRLEGYAKDHPKLCRLTVAGTTPEGRDILVLEVTDTACGQYEDKPAYYVEGNIHNQLGETEAAIASYDKCAEVNPSYEYGYIGKGILYYNKAVEIQEMANSENDDAKYDALVKEFESTLKSCVEPFEKAFELTQTEDVKASVAEYLKNACFRFREDETYAAKYQKYADASAKK